MSITRLSCPFERGDVVFDGEAPGVLGIVTEVRGRGISVVWEHGGRSGGPGLLLSIRHREPHLCLEIPVGALGNRGWNREQAIKAALRRAGLRASRTASPRPLLARHDAPVLPLPPISPDGEGASCGLLASTERPCGRHRASSSENARGIAFHRPRGTKVSCRRPEGHAGDHCSVDGCPDHPGVVHCDACGLVQA
jgi:hypothetical protein